MKKELQPKKSVKKTVKKTTKGHKLKVKKVKNVEEQPNENNIEVNRITDHRIVDNSLEFRVEWEKGNMDGISWFKQCEMVNCEKLINEYWKRVKTNQIEKIHSDDQLYANVDPFYNDNTFSSKKMAKRKHDPDEDQDEPDVLIDRAKQAKIGKDDVVAEIENILKCEKYNGQNHYQIKWVGSGCPTWISENDFFEVDMLNEFKKCEKIRNDPNVKTRRAYIYCRTSCRNSEKEVSLSDQEKICQQFAKDNQINVIGIFRDNGVSAKDINKQFALNYVIDQVKWKECILVYDITRFSRSMQQAIDKLETLRMNCVVVHSVHDGISWNHVATNRHNFRQILSTSQLHSDITSEKIRSAIKFKRERGDHIGYVPYGSMTQMVGGIRKLVDNPVEMKVIKVMCDEIINVVADQIDRMKIGSKNKKTDKKIKKKIIYDLNPKEYRIIAQNINELGYRNRGEKMFTWTFVRNVLTKWQGKL
jgi:DNA invertase Pin-like site-specific DNA recombinase